MVRTDNKIRLDTTDRFDNRRTENRNGKRQYARKINTDRFILTVINFISIISFEIFIPRPKTDAMSFDAMAFENNLKVHTSGHIL